MTAQSQPNSAEHTPTPWMQVMLHPHCILGAGQLACHAFSLEADFLLRRHNPEAARALCEANAAFIVEAVNGWCNIEALRARLAELTGEDQS